MLYALSIRVISFDCYGTLFDWLYSIRGVLEYLFKRDVLDKFFECEQAELSSFKPYSTILRSCLRRLMEKHGLSYSERYGNALVLGFAKSPPFPDVVPGLELLKEKGYKLAIISNTEHKLIDITLAGIRDFFNWVITAEDTGYYKPNLKAFTIAYKLMGVELSEVLHVSAYPYYDLEPARKLGVKTIMINRYGYEWSPSIRSLEEIIDYI